MLHKLLKSLANKEEFDVAYGVGLVVIIAVMEFCRSMLFALGWVTNYTTGTYTLLIESVTSRCWKSIDFN